MKKHLLFIFLLAISIFNLNAQDYQWAYTTTKVPLSYVAAIRKDQGNNFYLATQRDSSVFHLYSELEKRDDSQQLLWSKQILGDVIISDLEINPSNNVVVIGYYKDTLAIDGITIINSSPDYSGFIFEADENGTLLWAHDINPINNDFRPIELFIAQNGSMYITTELSGALNDFTSFHKLDLQGNIVKSEFNNNTEVRTYTNLIADNEGNVYISGTCGNFATFDTIEANVNYSYQNFVIKYDSSFKAQWFHSRDYITFDHNNSLQTNGQSLYWAFDDFSQNVDTVKIVNIENNGTYVSEFSAPMPQSFFPGLQFAMDSTGNSTLIFEIYTRLFLYRFDQSFNMTWQDTIMSGVSGFPSTCDLICYDSSFYLAARYYSDTMQVGNFTLINPNQGANNPTDNFVTLWKEGTATSVGEVDNSSENILAYPNPANDKINFTLNSNSHYVVELKIYDSIGRMVYSKIKTTSEAIDISNLSDGLYYLKVRSGDIVRSEKFVKQ